MLYFIESFDNVLVAELSFTNVNDAEFGVEIV